MDPNSQHDAYGFVSIILYGAVAAFLARVLILSIKLPSEVSWRALFRKRRLEVKPTEYSNVFPPSQRKRLPCESSQDSAVATLIDLSRHPELLLRLEEDYRTASAARFLFSGFCVGDVRALGNFPNYAELCEVPLPTAVEDFNIKTAKARPYRPLRWPYHQTMAIQRLEPDYWIELESTYEEQIEERKSIIKKHGLDVMQALPGSELACKELMEMVIQFLCARYPQQFVLKGNTFINSIRGTEYDVFGIPALQFLAENVPEDFAIMIRDPNTGTYKFRAGIICASTGWNLGGKIGKGLAEIHSPVPDYRSKMQLSMDRFFTKFPASKPVQRGAWGFEVGEHLYTPPRHSDLQALRVQDPQLQPDDLRFRVDWQTLRRLPLSGAIVFNFKAFFTPVTELIDEPYIPSLCLKVLQESKANLREYKQVHHTEHVLVPMLQQYEKYQLEKGLIRPNWEPQTLAESPFFPGWQDRHQCCGGMG